MVLTDISLEWALKRYLNKNLAAGIEVYVVDSGKEDDGTNAIAIGYGYRLKGIELTQKLAEMTAELIAELLQFKSYKLRRVGIKKENAAIEVEGLTKEDIVRLYTLCKVAGTYEEEEGHGLFSWEI